MDNAKLKGFAPGGLVKHIARVFMFAIFSGAACARIYWSKAIFDLIRYLPQTNLTLLERCLILYIYTVINRGITMAMNRIQFQAG
ncbi:MAG: hypothetical protein WBK51_12675, partial [Polaromonas sp.]